MSEKTIGAFLLSLRKENGYTQQEVADRLNVSNKTISKWERDDGCPDIKILTSIADLYGVTVDEILRGERNSDSRKAEIRNDINNTEEKALMKFKNISMVSVVFSAVTAIMSYMFAELVFDYDFIYIAFAFILMMVVASVIAAVVSYNNLVSALNENITSEMKKKACRLSFLLTAFSSVTLLIGMCKVTGIYEAIVLLVAPFIGVLIAFFVYFITKRKLVGKETLPYQVKRLRKKAVTATSVIIVLIAVFSALASLEVAQSNYAETSYGFLEMYDYDRSMEEYAAREYNLLKSAVIEGKAVYLPTSFSDDDSMNISAIEVNFTAEKYNDRYIISRYTESDEMHMLFTDSNEKEKFIEENAFVDYCDFGMLNYMKSIRFEDETYTIYYKEGIDGETYIVISDIAPLIMLIGTALVAVTVCISYAIYSQEKKTLINHIQH